MLHEDSHFNATVEQREKVLISFNQMSLQYGAPKDGDRIVVFKFS